MWLTTGSKIWAHVGRRFSFGAVFTGILLLLVACSGGPDLSVPGNVEPKGKTVPPVVISQIVGMPPGKINDMKTALAVAGGERDIGIVEGQFQNGSFSLSGQFQAYVESSGVKVIYQWQLRDADGVLLQTIDGDDNAGVATGADPWAAVSSAVFQRIAKRTAESMAGKLSSMGYATRLSALYVPPGEYFAAAGWGAQREIDFETLNGPGLGSLGFDMAAPPEDIPASTASVEPLPDEGKHPRSNSGNPASQVTSPAESPSAAESRPARTGAAIRAVAVLPVNGSSGGGDAELTAAMRKTLANAGWPVVTKRQADALTVIGRVQMGEKNGPNQRVSVRWEVQTPDGRKLGELNQANNVPAGALDRGWGPAAFAVAEAAAGGIFDIVKRLQ
jgi:hypothetical protein